MPPGQTWKEPSEGRSWLSPHFLGHRWGGCRAAPAARAFGRPWAERPAPLTSVRSPWGRLPRSSWRARTRAVCRYLWAQRSGVSTALGHCERRCRRGARRGGGPLLVSDVWPRVWPPLQSDCERQGRVGVEGARGDPHPCSRTLLCPPVPPARSGSTGLSCEAPDCGPGAERPGPGQRGQVQGQRGQVETGPQPLGPSGLLASPSASSTVWTWGPVSAGSP